MYHIDEGRPEGLRREENKRSFDSELRNIGAIPSLRMHRGKNSRSGASQAGILSVGGVAPQRESTGVEGSFVLVLLARLFEETKGIHDFDSEFRPRLVRRPTQSKHVVASQTADIALENHAVASAKVLFRELPARHILRPRQSLKLPATSEGKGQVTGNREQKSPDDPIPVPCAPLSKINFSLDSY